MNTKLVKIEDTKQIKDEELAEAAQILRDGGHFIATNNFL